MAFNERAMNFSSTARWADEPAQRPVERRLFERMPVTDGWNAVLFPSDGNELYLSVEDISARGTGLMLPEEDILCALEPGTTLTLMVRSPEREFTRSVEIRWTAPVGDGLRIGGVYMDHKQLEPGSHRLQLDDLRIDASCAMRIPAHIAVRRKLLPFVEIDDVVHVACVDSQNVGHLPGVERMLKKTIAYWDVEETALNALIARVYGNEQPVAPALLAGRRPQGTEMQSTATLTEELLYAAYLSHASDIHIDPQPNGVTVRFRVDGRLELHQLLPSTLYNELISRLKVMSGMDIAEKRAPQDGRFSQTFSGGNRRIDIRAATLPTKYGERMTLRLLALNTEAMTLSKLGLSPGHKQIIEKFLRRSQGMMILTGPTGSGKTTTLYAAIRMLLTERKVNILTVEDPIEYEISGVAQCEVDDADKVNFSKALRSILRHDPDVVMIGEIRDQETANIAIKAALTGHLVLGTLHTNSSAATVPRLIDMGIEPYLVAATLGLAVAQRLVRRLCKHCRIPRFLTVRESLGLQRPELAGKTVYESCGCIYCLDKGYGGRVGLYELLPMKSEWSRGIASGLGEAGLAELMAGDGIPLLLDDAIGKMLDGEIPVSEVMQIASAW
jgi:general secretion pathway protein E